jgi:predicted DNA-binding antitoxin AbrB/MazE fold protein
MKEDMEKKLQAVYNNGVLQPLEPLPLEDMQQVTVTITDAPAISSDLAGYFTPEEWAAAARDDISLDQVRQALSTISGSLSGAVIEQRQER